MYSRYFPPERKADISSGSLSWWDAHWEDRFDSCPSQAPLAKCGEQPARPFKTLALKKVTTKQFAEGVRSYKDEEIKGILTSYLSNVSRGWACNPSLFPFFKVSKDISKNLHFTIQGLLNSLLWFKWHAYALIYVPLATEYCSPHDAEIPNKIDVVLKISSGSNR